MQPDVKNNQIAATRELGAFLASLENMESAEHRISFAFTAVCDAVEEICQQHKVNGSSVFTHEQRQCIAQVSFRLFGILDGKIKPPPPPKSVYEEFQREWKALPVMKKLKSFGSTLAAVVAIITIVEAGKLILSSKVDEGKKIERDLKSDKSEQQKSGQ